MESKKLEDSFQLHALRVKTLSKRPTDEQLLKLYALFKQSTIGDCNTDEPSLFYFQERSKWFAWKEFVGMPSEEAKYLYISFAQSLIKVYG